MYGDVYVYDHGPGLGVDVAIDLGGGRCAKLYTDPDPNADGGQVSCNKSLGQFALFGNGEKVWSKLDAGD